MDWINSRGNDLARIVGSTQQSATHVLDYGGNIAQLDKSMQSPGNPLAHLRRHSSLSALLETGTQGSPSRGRPVTPTRGGSMRTGGRSLL